MTCPNCKLENLQTASRCDCGYDFTSRDMKDSYLNLNNHKKAGNGLLVLGWIFAVLGNIIGLIISIILTFGKDRYGYRYDSETRKKGKGMFISAISMLCIKIMLIAAILISNLNMKKTGDQFVEQGCIDYENEDYLEAVESLKKAIDLGVDEYKLEEVYTIVGNVYCELETYDNAIENYKKALNVNDNYCEAWINLGSSYREKGELDLAEEAYFNAHKINPNDAELHSSLGNLYLIKDELQKAIDEYELAIELGASNPFIYANGAYAYALTGNYEKADLFLENAMELGYKNYDEMLWQINTLKFQDELTP